MRRVLFVCPRLDVGGAERQWAALIPRLPAHGLDVRVVSLDADPGRLMDVIAAGGVPHSSLGGARGGAAGLARSLLAEGRGRPDVVVSWGFNAALAAALASAAWRVPHLVNWQWQPGWPLRPRQRAAVIGAARLGGGAIGVSGSQRPELEGLGFPAQRIAVVPNGVEVTVPDAEGRRALRRELGAGEGDFLAILVARLRPEKRIGDFVAAVQRAHAADGRIRGVVVGDGPLEAELRASLRAAPPGGVSLLGYRADAAAVMSVADAACLTSAHEALPLALIEAAASGRPLLSSRVGGTDEIVRDGETGYLFEAGDTGALAGLLLRLAGDEPLCAQLGDGARRRYEGAFTLAATVRGYARVLHAVDGPRVHLGGGDGA